MTRLVPVTFFWSLGLTYYYNHKPFQNLHFLHLILIVNDLSQLFLHQTLHPSDKSSTCWFVPEFVRVLGTKCPEAADTLFHVCG